MRGRQQSPAPRRPVHTRGAHSPHVLLAPPATAPPVAAHVGTPPLRQASENPLSTLSQPPSSTSLLFLSPPAPSAPQAADEQLKEYGGFTAAMGESAPSWGLEA